ncbi:RNA-directed DNA polymerase, eukaryota, reverse transcriptase zinc-binding domain protein [Tanacetum coccineum]
MGLEKCKAISKLCKGHNITFLGIQETRLSLINSFKAKSLWGNFHFEYAVSPSIGRSGGLISIWDPNSFRKSNEGKLWDVPLGGHSFTGISVRGDKLSKLDRFLISEDSTPYFQNFSALVLDSLISDHKPIVLKPSTLDFGPTPFKFYNSWLLDNKIRELVSQFWEKHIVEVGSNPIIDFKNKMKALKPIIKEWSKNLNALKLFEKNELINKIKEFDNNIENGIGGQFVDSP